MIINIDSDLEKKLGLNNVTLSELNPGDVFKDTNGTEYIVLEHIDSGTTAILRKEFLKEMLFGDNNDWRHSKIRKYLNNEYIKELENIFGKENCNVICPVNLLSLDGLDDYGYCYDKINLLTVDQYRKYRKVIKKDMSSWWWLSTPNSTESGDGDDFVQCVNEYGSVCHRETNYHFGGVRPYFILNSSIFVSLPIK